jgi:transcriptional regulator with XRE-family HTH domain
MIDWQTLTLSLRQHYKPLELVADEIGMSRQHINRLARGEVAEPRFNTGVKLLDLAYDVLPPEQFMRCRL